MFRSVFVKKKKTRYDLTGIEIPRRVLGIICQLLKGCLNQTRADARLRRAARALALELKAHRVRLAALEMSRGRVKLRRRFNCGS